MALAVQKSLLNPTDSMPCGIICQLHYDGGGSVQYNDASGALVCLTFLPGEKLRIGQQVSFAVSQRGEAIDIEPIEPIEPLFVCGQQENPLKNHKNAGCQHLLEIPDWVPSEVPTTKLSELQTRRLQRSICQFHNATVDERMEMLREAEGLLENLLNEATLDGNAICRLACRCVGWLHPEKNVAASVESKCVATVGLSQATSLQCRVRRLLILALSSLDLSDSSTYQAVETAVAYIAQVMKACDGKAPQASRPSRATRQWQQLRELIAATTSVVEKVAPISQRDLKTTYQEDQKLESVCSQDPGIFPEANLHEKKMLKRQITSGEDRAGMLQGAYYPSKKVKGLDSVFSSDQAVRLECPMCHESISSNWYWRHPKTEDVYVLVPSKGHSACNRKVGKRCYWRADADGKPTLLDNFQQLDFCPHHRRRVGCRDCGGSQICCHQKPWYHCAVCKMRPRIRKKSVKPQNGKASHGSYGLWM